MQTTQHNHAWRREGQWEKFRALAANCLSKHEQQGFNAYSSFRTAWVILEIEPAMGMHVADKAADPDSSWAPAGLFGPGGGAERSTTLCFASLSFASGFNSWASAFPRSGSVLQGCSRYVRNERDSRAPTTSSGKPEKITPPLGQARVQSQGLERDLLQTSNKHAQPLTKPALAHLPWKRSTFARAASSVASRDDQFIRR